MQTTISTVGQHRDKTDIENNKNPKLNNTSKSSGKLHSQNHVFSIGSL